MSESDRDVVVVSEDGLEAVVRRDPKPGERSVLINVAADREFAVPYHFHPKGHEWMQVRSGYVDFTINSKKTRLTPEMGELHIPAGARHSVFKPKGVAVVAMERSEPDAAGKSLFFEELFALGLEAGFVPVMACFWRNGDIYPAFGDYVPKIVGKVLVWVVGGFIGEFLGFGRVPPAKKQ